MPYYFTCPACKQRNHGNKNRPEGQNYFTDTTCKQCGKSGLYWVADSTMAEKLTTQRGVSPSLIVIGAGESNNNIIINEDPKFASGDPKDIAELLRPYATLEAIYCQGERNGAFRSEIPVLDNVREGQCAGQSLHWIRRVLQDSKATYRVDRIKNGVERPDEYMLAKQKKQAKIGAETQLAIQQRKNAVRARELVNPMEAQVEQKIRVWLASKGITVTPEGLYSVPPDLRWEWPEIERKMTDARQQVADQGFYQWDWDDFSKKLDHLHSKRPFSGIVAVASHNRVPHSDAPAFAHAVVNDSLFNVGSAALISVGLAEGRGEAGGSIGGHAIAAHYKGNNELYLFDPNIGVFMCRDKDKLKMALQTLIGSGWTTVLRWSLDNEFGYSLFERRAAPEKVLPQETPVVVTPTSPVATYYENKQIIPVKVTTTTTVTRPPRPTTKAPVPSPSLLKMPSSLAPPRPTTKPTGFAPQ